MSSIYYRELGKGPTLVLLHGYCETNEIWGDFATQLSKHCRLIIPDLPGFGKSPLPDRVTIDGVAQMMWDWLSEISVDAPTVIGHSLGGYVTLAMAARQPDGLNKIGLFHSNANEDTPERKANRDKVIQFVKTNGVEPYIRTYVPGLFYKKETPEVALTYNICKEVNESTLIAYAEAMRDRPGRHDVLKTFKGPVLIIAGENDELMPPAALEEQAKMAQMATFEVIPATGHMGMLEAPQKSVDIIRNFMGLR